MRLANGLLAAVIALLAAAWLLNRKKIAAVGSPQKKGRAKGSVRSLLRNRNIIVCILGGIFSLIACWCIYVYAPTLLKATERYTDSTMSFIMTAMGVFMTAWMLFLPYIGGRIGYKPVAIVFSACGAGSLLALFLKADSLFCVTCFILFGGCCSVISMIYMAIITVDSTEAEQSAAAVALVNALGELLGASVGPLLAGMLSDAYGMKYGMLFAGGSMAIVTAVGFFLKKTEKIQ